MNGDYNYNSSDGKFIRQVDNVRGEKNELITVQLHMVKLKVDCVRYVTLHLEVAPECLGNCWAIGINTETDETQCLKAYALYSDRFEKKPNANYYTNPEPPYGRAVWLHTCADAYKDLTDTSRQWGTFRQIWIELNATVITENWPTTQQTVKKSYCPNTNCDKRPRYECVEGFHGSNCVCDQEKWLGVCDAFIDKSNTYSVNVMGTRSNLGNFRSNQHAMCTALDTKFGGYRNDESWLRTFEFKKEASAQAIAEGGKFDALQQYGYNGIAGFEKATVFPPNLLVLGTTNIGAFQLSRTRMADIPEEAFNTNTNLQRLHITYNSMLTSLPAKLFAKTTRLTNLWLTGNHLLTLPETIFDSMHLQLYVLKLDGNPLEKLPLRVFSNLRNLTELYLGYTCLTTIDPGVFKGLRSLGMLNLRGSSKLAALPPYLFQNLASSLQQLNLEGCPLRSFTEKSIGYVGGFPNLKSVALGETLPVWKGFAKMGSAGQLCLSGSTRYVCSMPEKTCDGVFSLSSDRRFYDINGTSCDAFCARAGLGCQDAWGFNESISDEADRICLKPTATANPNEQQETLMRANETSSKVVTTNKGQESCGIKTFARSRRCRCAEADALKPQSANDAMVIQCDITSFPGGKENAYKWSLARALPFETKNRTITWPDDVRCKCLGLYEIKAIDGGYACVNVQKLSVVSENGSPRIPVLSDASVRNLLQPVPTAIRRASASQRKAGYNVDISSWGPFAPSRQYLLRPPGINATASYAPSGYELLMASAQTDFKITVQTVGAKGQRQRVFVFVGEKPGLYTVSLLAQSTGLTLISKDNTFQKVIVEILNISVQASTLQMITSLPFFKMAPKSGFEIHCCIPAP